MPEVTRRRCPLGSCDWYHDEPGPWIEAADWVEPTGDDLEQAGGDWQAAVVLATLRADMQRTEAVLRAHVKTHPLQEWVAEVVRLSGLLAVRD